MHIYAIDTATETWIVRAACRRDAMSYLGTVDEEALIERLPTSDELYLAENGDAVVKKTVKMWAKGPAGVLARSRLDT